MMQPDYLGLASISRPNRAAAYLLAVTVLTWWGGIGSAAGEAPSLLRSRLADRQPISVGTELRYGMTYQEIKASQIRHTMLRPSPNPSRQRLETVLKTRIGQRGFDNVFGSADRSMGRIVPGSGKLTLPVKTPGLQNIVESSTYNQWRSGRGHLQTLSYAERMHRSGKMTIEGLNQRFVIVVDGKSVAGDADILARCKRTGQGSMLEVKNRLKSSMKRTDIKVLAQSSKEIRLAKSLDRTFALINRQGLPDSIKRGVTSMGGQWVEKASSRQISRQLARILPTRSHGSRIRGLSGGNSRLLGATGVAIEIGFRGYDSYSTERDFAAGLITKGERWQSHAGNAGGAVGGAAGAWAAAVAGAEVGGAVGTLIFPGPGTAIGAGIGATAGGAAGGWAGDRAGSAMGRGAVSAGPGYIESYGDAFMRTYWLRSH